MDFKGFLKDLICFMPMFLKAGSCACRCPEKQRETILYHLCRRNGIKTTLRGHTCKHFPS